MNGDDRREQRQTTPLREDVSREQIRQLHFNLTGTFVAVPVGASFILYILQHEIGSSLILLWYFAVLAFVALRVWAYIAFRKVSATSFDVAKWGNMFSWFTIVAGIIWGAAPLVSYADNSLSEQMFLVLMVGGMAAGGAFSYAAMPRTVQTYLFFALVPIIYVNFRAGDLEHMPVAIMAVIYYLIMAVLARNSSRQVLHAVHLAFDNRALLQEATLAREVSEAAARRLAEEVENKEKISQTLSSKNHLLNSVLDATPLAVIMFDSSGIIRLWNKGAGKMFGWDSEEVLGEPCPLLHGGAEAGMRNLLNGVFKGEMVRGREVPVRRKDGEQITIEAHVAPLSDEGGISYAIAIMADITEQKRIERLLREEQDRFKFLTHVAEEGIGILEEGILHAVNPRIVEMFGCDVPEEIVGKPFADLFTPESAEALKNLMSFSNSHFEAEIVKAGGERIVVEVKGKQAVYRGQMMQIAVLRDITKRKKIETDLRESEEKFRTLVNSMEDGVFVMDLQHRFTGFFGNWLSKHSITESRFIGRTFRQMFGAEVGAIHEEAASRALQGEVVNYEWSLEWQDIHLFYHTTLSPIRSGGVIIGAVGVGRDITPLKEKEEELQKAKDIAEKATKLKDKFVSLVAHDLKSPFAVILGSLQLIGEDDGDKLSPINRKLLDSSLGSGRNLIRMIEDLLSISRLQSGAIQARPRFVEARGLVSRVIQTLEYVAHNKGVEIRNNVPAGEMFYCDPELFGEVLHNLLTNAVKFSRAGGKVEVMLAGGGMAGIAVKDDGVGVPADMLPKLFMHEVKTSLPGTGGEKGTGLGLPLSNDLMKAQSGELIAESEEGKGSTFTATLPDIRPKILLVDDDKLTRVLVEEMLKELRVETVVATGVDEALDLLQNLRFDLLISDIVMPGGDGLQLVAAVRGRGMLKLPILMMTGVGGREAREKALSLGANDFCGKPLDRDDLVFRVHKLLIS